MNFGDCPYCDKFLGLLPCPDKTPAFAKIKCEHCGKEIWYRFSRVDPQAWRVEDFEKEFEVDDELKTIKEKL